MNNATLHGAWGMSRASPTRQTRSLDHLENGPAIGSPRRALLPALTARRFCWFKIRGVKRSPHPVEQGISSTSAPLCREANWHSGGAFKMAKNLHKIQKHITKKRGGKLEALHENSRDAKRLRRAGAREDRLARIASAISKGRQLYGELPAQVQISICYYYTQGDHVRVANSLSPS